MVKNGNAKVEVYGKTTEISYNGGFFGKITVHREMVDATTHGMLLTSILKDMGYNVEFRIYED
jgi:hypothetical protein